MAVWSGLRFHGCLSTGFTCSFLAQFPKSLSDCQVLGRREGLAEIRSSLCPTCLEVQSDAEIHVNKHGNR